METAIARMAEPLESVEQKITALLTSKWLPILIISYGIILRAARYFFNPALYVDEGSLALNIIHRPLGGLLHSLDYNQAAPFGFLALERIAFLAFGQSEYALRLVPFLASIAALFLFYEVARRVLAAWAAPIALALFAVSDHMIYYGAQIKQYSSDTAATLLVVLAGLEIASKRLTPLRALLFALTGAAILWLSHPSVFVLAGVGTALLLGAIKRKDWPSLKLLAFSIAGWLASFALFYAVSLSKLGANQTLESSWNRKGTFMPLPPTTLKEFGWFPDAFFSMFTNPVGSPFPIAAGLVFIIGCAALLRKKTHLLMLTAPVLFTLLGSAAHKYPFGRRLLLFIVPLVMLVMIAGVQYLIEARGKWSLIAGVLILELMLYQIAAGGASLPSMKRLAAFVAVSFAIIGATVWLIARREHLKYGFAAGAMIALLLLLQPAAGATRHMFNQRARQNIKPVMKYVAENRQPGDTLYVYYHQRESFLYYAGKYGYKEGEYIIGIDPRNEKKRLIKEQYRADLDQLRGRGRVWVMFSHVRSPGGVNEEEAFVGYLDSIGKQLHYHKSHGASVYLYDLVSP
ncbi:MAG TPA: glycosyltransferase family 39 protein [Blastocatellia bacterium]|jgi:4-amino-4-deoxy-L-arabinose transferase-like glycosyltransferase